MDEQDEAPVGTGASQKHSGENFTTYGSHASSPAVELLGLALDADLFHNDAGFNYATFSHRSVRQTWPVESKAFARWLSLQSYQKLGEPANKRVLDDVVAVLAAQAQFDGPSREVAIRVGSANGRVYVDLCDDEWRAVEITPKGWKIVTNPPVRFIRPRGMLPMPEPKRGGALQDLASLFSIHDADMDIIVMTLLGALRPLGPYAITVFEGPQGTAKTSTTKLVRALIDPNVAPVRGQPKEEKDLLIAANHSRLIALDNLSSMPRSLADRLCRLVSGAGISTRELYTDVDEIVLSACRPVLLNSVNSLMTFPDLIDRALVVPCRTISARERRSEEQIEVQFQRMRPKLMGALYTGVASTLAHGGTQGYEELPRLADLAFWCDGAASKLGWPPGAAARRIIEHQAGARRAAVEGDPFARGVLELAKHADGWNGTSDALLKRLNQSVPAGERATVAWPTSPEGARARLDSVRPSLRVLGVEVTFARRGHGGHRAMTIRC